jgi:fatty acid desaturase
VPRRAEPSDSAIAGGKPILTRADWNTLGALNDTVHLDFDPRELARPSSWRAMLEIGVTWALIGAAIAAYLRWPRWWSFLAAFVFVASRQYALLILLHDAFHALLHPNRRVNDLLGGLTLGAPCGSAYWPSRSVHLEHHRCLGEADDPELFLHSAGPPREKRALPRLLWHFLRLVLGDQALHTHLGSKASANASLMTRLRRVARGMIPVVIAQLALVMLFVIAGSWSTYLTLWVLPLLTLPVLFNGIRAFCDHANVTDEPGGKDHRLVTYRSSPPERFFIAPFHMNYHAEHHLFPYVPHYRLPALRRRIEQAVMASAIQWRGGYFSFMCNFLLAQRRQRA